MTESSKHITGQSLKNISDDYIKTALPRLITANDELLRKRASSGYKDATITYRNEDLCNLYRKAIETYPEFDSIKFNIWFLPPHSGGGGCKIKATWN